MRKSLRKAFIRNLHDKSFCETFMWNLYAALLEPKSLSGTFSATLGTCKGGTFMWNLSEPQTFDSGTIYVEPCGTSTFDSGTFMWNLVEPQLLRVEPFCGTLWNLNF